MPKPTNFHNRSLDEILIETKKDINLIRKTTEKQIQTTIGISRAKFAVQLIETNLREIKRLIELDKE